MNAIEQKSLVSPQQTKFSDQIRNATRARIYAYLQKRISTKSDSYSPEKLQRLTSTMEKQLMIMAKTEKEYSDLATLEFRVERLLRQLYKKVSSHHRASPPTPVDMTTVSRPLDTSMATFSNLPNATLQSGSIPPNNNTNGGGSIFNRCQQASAGFPSSSGDSGFNRTSNIDQSIYSDSVRVSDLQRHQTTGANVHMVDVYRPNNVHQTSSGFGISRNNSLPVATRPMTSEELFMSTYMPNLSKPLVQPVDQLHAAPQMHSYSMSNPDSFGSSNFYGNVTSSGPMAVLAQNPNPMLRADATFTSNQSNLQGMQQTLLPLHQLGNNGFQSAYTNKENLAQVSRQLLDRGFHQQAHDMEQQGQQRFQQFYPGQLQKQDHLLHEDAAYRNQLARGLATPVSHGPSLDVYKEALQKQVLNGFRPSKFQYQQNAVKDQYIGAQSASVHNSQLNSSPSFQLHPHQKQPASVQVQTQSSLQKLDPHQKQLASAVVQTYSSLQKRDAHQKQSASVQVQTQSSLQKRDAHQKQTESAVVQTQPSVQKPQPRQKQPESVLLQMQSSLQKPHPHQKQSESAVVQTHPSVQKQHPRQEQLDSVLVQTQSSLEKPHLHQKQSESVMVQTQPSLEKPPPCQKQSSVEKPPPCQKQSSQPSLEKPHPHQQQSESVMVQTQPSLQKPHLHQKQSESVMVQTQPSLQKPHPLQKQSESVLVQTQPSLQKPTQISENNNVEREQMEVNLCQITPILPEAVNRCSSARPPICPQTVSPTSTAKRKRLPDGNNTSSKLDKRYGGPIVINKIRWILFMSHARYCSAPEGKCGTGFCDRAKETLKHAQHCKIPDCTYLNCLRTRELMRHSKQCRDKSCRVCVSVKNLKKKYREASLRAAKLQLASLQGRQRESLESRQADNKGSTKALSVDDDDLQPSMKRLKLDQPSQNATPETESKSVSVCDVVCKSHSSMHIQGKDGLLSDDCKSVKVEVKPMDIEVSAPSGIPITREVEKHVVEDTPKGKNGGEFAMDDKTVCLSAQGKSECRNEMSASKEENVKQPVDDAVDASKMEISSLVELFTPAQVREHIRGLRQWIGQSKIKADKNKAMACSITKNSCQLCAVTTLYFEPIPIYCTPCGVRIKRNASHYTVMAGESRHYVCTPCYNDARENSVSIDGTSIPKARLEKKKKDEPAEEAWVQCDKCQAWQHQICALFNNRTNHGEATKYTCPKCYIQEVEQGERRPLPQNAIPGAKSLPVTTLSNHIEQRLFKNLKKERQERARFQGKSYEEVPGAESLAVRVVASVDKVLEVKECFRELFREENYPSEFPYKSKAILLFQRIESVEVCLFGMFVQEFGTKSGPPNQRRVYISYLDSVKYFRPEVRTVSGEALRTFVYHEILIGYLDYCKKRGFTSCYIWACPPLKGEDYILYCHPEIQKTPKTDKLRDWYLAMLRKASKEDVVVECTNLYDQFFVQSGECRANVTAARLPYFDGDYWPGAAADLIHQMSQEDDGTKLNRKGFTKKVISKRALKAVGESDLSVNASKDRLTMQKLGEIICPLKEDFIMVHLQHCCKHCCTLMVSGNRWECNHCKNFQICDKCNEAEQKRGEKERHPVNQKEKHTLFPVAIKDVPIEIEEKDDNIESEFFDNRQVFLNLCQGNNYQYDTLRQAKHSSMMLLYHLHNPTAPAFPTICTICQQVVENAQGWRCGICPGYDVCNACHSKASIDHPHNLISRSSTTDTVEQNGQVNRNGQIQLEKVKQMLVHVAACRSLQCQYPGCHGLKVLFKHCKSCKIGAASCPICRRFWWTINFHARFCRDSQCTALFCREIRANNIRKQQQSEKRRRAAVTEMMRERAAEATRSS